MNLCLNQDYSYHIIICSVIISFSSLFIIMQKQFRQPNVKQPPLQRKENSSVGEASTLGSRHQGNVSDKPFSALQRQEQPEPSGEEKRSSVHDRLRIPVSYDDDFLELSTDKNPT